MDFAGLSYVQKRVLFRTLARSILFDAPHPPREYDGPAGNASNAPPSAIEREDLAEILCSEIRLLVQPNGERSISTAALVAEEGDHNRQSEKPMYLRGADRKRAVS
jgi:hypothetical protein